MHLRHFDVLFTSPSLFSHRRQTKHVPLFFQYRNYIEKIFKTVYSESNRKTVTLAIRDPVFFLEFLRSTRVPQNDMFCFIYSPQNLVKSIWFCSMWFVNGQSEIGNKKPVRKLRYLRIEIEHPLFYCHYRTTLTKKKGQRRNLLSISL